MKLVSLNIRHGGGTRSSQILDWLNIQSADFILLTEWRQNASGLSLKALIEEQGYKSVGNSKGPAANGLLVASRCHFKTLELTPPGSLNGEIVAADLANGCRVLCCYFPQLAEKRTFFDLCIEQATNLKTPLLIVGDLNTGNNDVDLNRGATKFACATQFDELTQSAGMIDLWRLSNGKNAQEWTWHSSKNGFRIDHVFGNQAFIASFSTTKCWYDNSTRETGLTDHSAAILEAAP